MRNLAILTWLALAAVAQDSSSTQKLAPYYPTPETIVIKMLEMGGLKAAEKIFDLGSGDGRIVIIAAQKFHVEATRCTFTGLSNVRRLTRPFPPGFDWNRYLASARVLIALLAVASVVSTPRYSFFFAGALVAFAAYALMVAFRRPTHEGPLGL